MTIAIISTVTVLILLGMIAYLIRYKWAWMRFRNFTLKDDSNENIHKDIDNFKFKVTKEKIIVTVDTVPTHYTNQEAMNKLIDALPVLLERKFKLHFEDRKNRNIITYTAMRQK